VDVPERVCADARGAQQHFDDKEPCMSTPYTHKKLTEVEDSAPKFGLAGMGETRFATGDLDAADTGVSLLRINAGRRQPFAHKHDEAEEVYVVLSGSGRVKLDDAIIDISELDAIRVAPGVTRSFEAGADGLQVLACGPHHAGDGELIQDWWKD
jgi:mannose-6-phosphate isomerase-like protein (cupin superfamily)